MSRRHELRTSTGSDDDAQYLALVEALEALAHDKEVSMIVAAMSFVLGAVLAETGQHRIKSINYVCKTIIDVYEQHEKHEQANPTKPDHGQDKE
jgi:hypothetical protein